MIVPRKYRINTLNERVLEIQYKLSLRDIFYNFSRVQIFNISFSYLKLQRLFETQHFKNYAKKARVPFIWQESFLFLSLAVAFIVFPFRVSANLLSPTCEKYSIPYDCDVSKCTWIYAQRLVTSGLTTRQNKVTVSYGACNDTRARNEDLW